MVLWREWVGKSGRLFKPMHDVMDDNDALIDGVMAVPKAFPDEEAVKREVQRYQTSRRRLLYKPTPFAMSASIPSQP